jgi:hypothetical protein
VKSDTADERGVSRIKAQTRGGQSRVRRTADLGRDHRQPFMVDLPSEVSHRRLNMHSKRPAQTGRPVTNLDPDQFGTDAVAMVEPLGVRKAHYVIVWVATDGVEKSRLIRRFLVPYAVTHRGFQRRVSNYPPPRLRAA